MPHYLHTIILSVLLANTSYVSAAAPLPATDQWVKLIGWNDPGVTAYYSPASISRAGSIGDGMFLFVKKEVVIVDISGVKFKTNSVIRHIAVECGKSAFVPLADYYYNTKSLPKLTNDAIVMVDHTRAGVTPQAIPNTHILYKTICPTYI